MFTTNSLLSFKDTSTLDSFFDDVFSKTFPEFTRNYGFTFTKDAYPKVNIIDQPEKIKIIAEISGLSKEQISVKVEDFNLTIQGESKQIHEEGTYLVRELKRSKFSRTFSFGEKFNMSDIKANFDNGVLTIEVPKKDKEISKIKNVEIQ